VVKNRKMEGMKILMSYISSTLSEGERIIYQTKLHWIIFLWPIILLFLGYKSDSDNILVFSFAYSGLSGQQFRRHPDIKPGTSGHPADYFDFMTIN